LDAAADVEMLVNDLGDPQPFVDSQSALTASVSDDRRIHRFAFAFLMFTFTGIVFTCLLLLPFNLLVAVFYLGLVYSLVVLPLY